MVGYVSSYDQHLRPISFVVIIGSPQSIVSQYPVALGTKRIR